MRNPPLEGFENAGLVQSLDRDDERETKAADIVGIELRETLTLVIGQGIKPGASLLTGGLRRQSFGGGQFACQVGMGL